MTEQELRALVRESIVRHLDLRSGVRPAPGPAGLLAHPSHGLLPVHPGADEADGACLIEPTVGCIHCGYCQSYGH